MRVLMLGDIYGRPGRRAACELVKELRSRWKADWVIANGENATGGAGLSPRHRNILIASGIDMLTSGNHIFARPDWPELLGGSDGNVLRPHNLGGDDRPGRGWGILGADTPGALGVINLAGRVFMEPGDCPFRTADRLLQKFPAGVPVLVDMHAEATSEKIALSWHLDGRAAAVVGSHTHVQTADERVLPGGTAVITDLGMTGPRNGVLGVDRELVVSRFCRGFSDKFRPALGEVVLEGVVIEIGPDAKAVSIQRIREIGPVATATDDGEN